MDKVKLVNQNDYPNKIYITKTAKDEPDRTNGLSTTIASSGCGICCAVMVANFFGHDFSLDQAIELSYSCQANNGFGTKYKPYGNALAERFNLIVERTDKKETLFKHLDNGGCGVVNVGGDHDDHIGLFSHVGHYIFIYKHVNDEVYILDPGIEPNKYQEESRKGKVRFEGEFVISDYKYLQADILNRETPIFLFKKSSQDFSLEKVYTKIDELKDEFLTIWQDIVKIDSPSDYKEGVDKVGQYFIDYGAKQLWDIEIQENQIAGNAICITMNTNNKEKSIALSGHMDTVHPVGSLATYIKDNKIYGPGCSDCKGGLVVSLLAMKALKECGYRDRKIKLILQSDEEVGSKLSNGKNIDFIIQQAKDTIGFFNMEMYQPGSAVLQRKGIRKYKMSFRGVAAHASICQQGASAILEASHKIIELEKYKDSDDITINVGTIKGGSSANTVPDYCEILIDVRFNNQQSLLTVDNYINDIAQKEYVKNVVTTLEVVSTRIAMDYKEYNQQLLDKCNLIFKETGFSTLQPRKAMGGSDGAYTSNANIPTLDSLGVSGGNIHSPNEYSDIPSLAENAKRFVAIITKLK